MKRPYFDHKPIFPGNALAGPIPADAIRRLLLRITYMDIRFPIPKSWKCWRLEGWQDEKGYCQIRVNGRTQWAHRAAYVAFVADLPAGAEVHHTCNVPNCVNPDHLTVVSHAENTADSNRRTGFRGNGHTKHRKPKKGKVPF